MVDALLHDIARVEYGALVLFTSREQMRQAVDALPTAMRSVVLVQNALPRTQLLKRHRERVENGEPSVIFGMQSFGEGLDLPGRLCVGLHHQAPLPRPTTPWARPAPNGCAPWGATRSANWWCPPPPSAWRAMGGRAIRTEEDMAHVYCYDKRLTRTSYGQRLLKGCRRLRWSNARRCERCKVATPFHHDNQKDPMPTPCLPAPMRPGKHLPRWRNYVCPDCAFEWPQVADTTDTDADAGDGIVRDAVRDANGNPLADGDAVILVKDLKVKGSSSTLKKGTKIKSIRLVDGADGHNVDCKTTWAACC